MTLVHPEWIPSRTRGHNRASWVGTPDSHAILHGCPVPLSPLAPTAIVRGVYQYNKLKEKNPTWNISECKLKWKWMVAASESRLE